MYPLALSTLPATPSVSTLTRIVGAIVGSEDCAGDGFEVVGSDVEGSAVGDDKGSAVGDDVYAMPDVATLMFVPSMKSVR